MKSNSETEHTKTPWKVGKGPNGEVEIWGRMRLNTSPILMSLGIMESEPRDGNAEFIVRACNRDHQFDALVKALITARTWISTTGSGVAGDFKADMAEIDSVLSAIEDHSK